MGLFSRLKRWVRRTFGGGGGSSSRSSSSRASRVSNYGGGGSRSYRDYSSGSYRRDYQDRQEAERRRRQEQKRKQQATTNALASISKRTDALSSGRSPSVASTPSSTGNGIARTIRKIEQKATPPDVKLKQDAAKASRERATKMLEKIEANRKSYNKATGNRYNPEVGTKEERARARQRIKAGEYMSDFDAEKWEIKHHPKAMSAARGALSGTTLGASELLAQKSKKRQQAGIEKYYQTHKRKGYEIAGEVAGSLATFGATSALTERAGTKLVSKVAPNAVERLAGKKAIQKAAQRSVNKAVEKGLVSEGSEALVKQVGKAKAAKIMSALGNDIVQNLTTGALYDINKASAEHEIGSPEWWKEIGTSAALNAVTTGGVAGGSMLTGGKRLAVEAADALSRPRIGDATKAELPKMRQAMQDAFARESDDVARRIDMNELLAKNAPLRQADEAIRPQAVEEIRPQAVDNAVPQQPILNATEAAPDIGARASKLINDENKRIERLRELQWEINSARGGERARLKEARRYMTYDRANEIVPTPEERAELIRQRDALATALSGESNVIRREELGLQIETIDNILKREPRAELPRVDENGFPYEGTPEVAEPSQFAQVDEGMEGIAPEAEAEAKRTLSQSQEEQLASKIEERATGNKVTDEEALARRQNRQKLKEKEQRIKPRKMPKGEKLTARVTKNIEGSTFEEATKPASAKDIIEAESKYVRGQASNYEKVVSRGGTSLVSATGSEAETKVIKDLIDEDAFQYARVKNKQKYEWAVRDFVDNKETVTKKMLKYADDIDSIPASQLVDTHYQAHAVMKMMRSQLDNPALSAEEREAAREIYSAAASLTQRLASMSGQINQFQGVMVHCDGKTRMRNAVDNIADLLDSSRGFRRSKQGKQLSGNAFQRKNQIREIIYQDPDARKALEKIIDAATEEEYGNAMQELLYATSKMNRKHGLDYIQTWRYLAMLGNPKTHVRNVLGNITFGGIRNLSNTNRSFIEKRLEGYAKQHGLEIERHGKASITAFTEARSKNPATDAGKAAKEWFDKNKDVILSGAKYDEQVAKGGDPAMMKWLTWLSDGNSKILEGEDNFFRQRSYKESFIKSYDQYKRDGREITEELLEKIHKSAVKESQIATFNEFNSMAQVLSKWSHTNYNDTFGRKVAGWTVNAMMPFTKVPSNILKQSVNYSPIGVAKGIANITNAAKTGDSIAFNRAIDELSSGITGTGIAALGFFLGKGTDAFTTNAGSEDAAAKFKKQQGVQNYSMTFKDPTSGETYSVTLDWLVPASATFFAGVEMANQLKRGYGDLFEFVGDMSQVTSRIIEPVLETSMLSGLYNIVEGARNGTGEDEKMNFLSLTMRELTQSYANSLIPTIQGQAARTAYKSDKQLTGETDWEYWINSLKNKMGIADTNALGTEALGADTTAYGDVKNEKKTTGDYVKSGLKNFLSPANIQKVDLDEVDKAKIKQYEDAVRDGADPQEMAYLFPKKQYKKQFTTGDLDVTMSNKDLSTYNQAKTTGGAEGARYALESIMFNRYTKDENGKKHSTADAYTPEQKAAVIKQFEGKSIREVEKWVREQPQFKNSTEAEQKKVIDGLWSYSKQGKAQSAKRVGEQAVIAAQGGDVNEYNFNNEISEKKRQALMPYIEAGVLTYEQAVDFARFAGKTYYYEDDEGGHSQTYYNKGVMMDYLKSKGFSDEEAAALFNSFKASNAKEYGSSSGRRRRRGYRRRWRHYGHGGGSSKKATVPTPKAIKANQFVKGEALISKRSGSSSAKATPPTLKRVEAKIDLPTARFRKEY